MILYIKIKKYLNNVFWVVGEKLLLVIFSFAVNVIVVRFLGAKQFGEIQYVNSVLSFFNIFTSLGMVGILMHEYVDKPRLAERYLGTAFYLKLIGAIIGYVAFIVLMHQMHGNCTMEFYLSVIIGLTLFLQPFSVLHILFDAKVKAKYRVMASSISSVIGSILKVFLVIGGAGILYFGGVSVVVIIISTIIIVYFASSKLSINFRLVKFNYFIALRLLKKSWMLIFSSIFTIMYLKIDQIMLKWFMNSTEVGIYSVAVTLSETWYFIPTIIVTTIFPKLISIKKENSIKYKETLQLGYDSLFIVAFILSFLISIVAHPLIVNLYGESFIESASILSIHIWTGVFIFMRALFSKWLIMEGLFKYSIITNGLGAVVNVLLNYYIIPIYGGIGAAITSLISYSVSSYLSLFLSKQTREQAFMMSKAFTSPFRVKSIYYEFIK